MPPSTFLILCLLLTGCRLIQSSVFQNQAATAQLLHSTTRRRRANSFLLEEMLPGNLERECYEERCSQEEVAEIFQTREKTMEFWQRYTNLNLCRINPCLNGGLCTVERGAFMCLCPPQYSGKICESASPQCSYRNGGCLQYCRDLTGGTGVQCGCADGYRLESDGHSCSPTVAFPCGLQQAEAWSRGLSLSVQPEDIKVTMETETVWDSNVTYSWEHEINQTGSFINLTTVNASSEKTGNWTELWGGAGDRAEPRIVGGDLEKLGGSPWQVLIHRPDGFGFCGGTLVSDRWVVSAAHCMEESADYVTIGDYDKLRPDPAEQQIKIQKVVVHPHFHPFTFDSDIALLYLAQPVLRGPTATPACLPDAHLSTYLLRVTINTGWTPDENSELTQICVQEDNRGVVTGWGATQFLGRSSRFLRKVTVPVVSYEACTETTEQVREEKTLSCHGAPVYTCDPGKEEDLCGWMEVITDNMFCAGYLETRMDACSGDSGGPFVVHYRGVWFLTGVVSWGEKCAARGKYGVYTRLGNFLNWIRTTMEKQDQNRS